MTARVAEACTNPDSRTIVIFRSDPAALTAPLRYRTKERTITKLPEDASDPTSERRAIFVTVPANPTEPASNLVVFLLAAPAVNTTAVKPFDVALTALPALATDPDR